MGPKIRLWPCEPEGRIRPGLFIGRVGDNVFFNFTLLYTEITHILDAVGDGSSENDFGLREAQ